MRYPVNGSSQKKKKSDKKYHSHIILINFYQDNLLYIPLAGCSSEVALTLCLARASFPAEGFNSDIICLTSFPMPIKCTVADPSSFKA